MRLSRFIARRYLFAKKSHNVINVISLISGIGIAVGSCALVIILSVYNGFEDIVRGMYDRTSFDIVIKPSHGKYLRIDSCILDRLYSYGGIRTISGTVEENAFVTYGEQEGVVVIKGVDSAYGRTSGIADAVIEGKFELEHGQIAQAAVGMRTAVDMGIHSRFVNPISIYFPARGKTVSLTDPMSSLNMEKVYPAGIFSTGEASHDKLIYIGIGTARELMGLERDMAGAIEISLYPDERSDKAVKYIENALGDGYKVLDRYMQNETVYKMMKIEKAVIYMILLFIIIVVSCNVFGSLTMLIIEKRDDIGTLQSLGADNRLIKNIFLEEGMMITLYGAVCGILAGIVLCLVQQYVGVIEMPGNFVVKYYPVVIRPADILATFAGIAAIGIVITSLPTRKTLNRIL
ncbi:MAG TPA: ABC transporter permease [Candidatus Coprenecus stercoripullorum]|nr:ABC transporter permease [Candidatus Coprenecus stercoripullorum]